MKRLIALLLALPMALARAACGGNQTAGNNTAGNNGGESDTQTPVTDGTDDAPDKPTDTDEAGATEEGPIIDDVTLNHTTETPHAFGGNLPLPPEGVAGLSPHTLHPR